MTQRFTYCRVTDEPDQKRAVCTCGWSVQDTPTAVEAAVATHVCRLHLQEPRLKKSGFVSGQSDLKPGEGT